METKQIKIETPIGYEIDKEKSTFENIVFKKLESKYPLVVTEIPNRYWKIYSFGGIEKGSHGNKKFHLSSRSRAEAFLALMQLVELRDAWNRVDGFVVDWADTDQNKFVISVHKESLQMDIRGDLRGVLYFGSWGTVELFFRTFKDLIEQAKELL